MTIDVRPLKESDLPEADRIFRLAFGTFMGMPDPMTFSAGADLIGTRWRAPACNTAFGAFDGSTLVGSNYVANWGSFGFFGPLTVRPDYWSKGVGQLLLAPTMETFSRWGTRQASLFTFPHSAKHLALYQKYDFWPQQLIALTAKRASGEALSPEAFEGSRAALTAQARAVTEALYPGLDVSGEIDAVLDQTLGEIVTVRDGASLAAFAVCHVGPGSEAGPNVVYIKFAAARPGGANHFDALLAACEALAVRRGMGVVTAGVNTACHDAYRAMLTRGFRTQFTGVAMQRGNGAGYLGPDVFVLGDWR
jgi:GNAT superfamily N-acetyltransferase